MFIFGVCFLLYFAKLSAGKGFSSRSLFYIILITSVLKQLCSCHSFNKAGVFCSCRKARDKMGQTVINLYTFVNRDLIVHMHNLTKAYE